ncbi:MAG: DUF4349 domain-containing protein [Verrucomicrobia bacterium]|nr:DUF4349 domain-containing protein [Verrucomicrobiota bacterium]MCH8514407.1 DUF4349 domain-containing protein [Kiritimatiellia bacterium]
MKKSHSLVIACISLMLLNGCTTQRGRVSELSVRAGSPSHALPQSFAQTDRAVSPPDADVEVTPRMLITRSNLTLEVEDVEASMKSIVDEVAEVGGFVQNQNLVEDKRATLTLRIPSDKLPGFMAHLEEKGKVLHSRVNVEDITDQYVDLEARMGTLVALRDRLHTLLDRAETVEEVLRIERELSRVQGEIDSMEARLKSMRGRSEMATVQLELRRKRILGPVAWVGRGVGLGLRKLFVIRD